jgi:hypothetical protein
MRRLTEEHGAEFLILQLTRGSADAERYLRDSGVALADCAAFDPNLDLSSPASRVGGVGHPNGIVHASWAACLDDWLSRARHLITGDAIN